MKHGIITLAVAVVTTAANAQTNAVDARVEQLRKRIGDQIKRGPSVPIQLTPEEDALLVNEGVLPPIDQQATAVGTNAAPMVSLRMRNVSLAVAAESYSEFVGMRVTVQDGLTVPITVQTTGTVTRAQAAVLMEKAFAVQGLKVSLIDAGVVQIGRK
jgi:hypothetical protein